MPLKQSVLLRYICLLKWSCCVKRCHTNKIYSVVHIFLKEPFLFIYCFSVCISKRLKLHFDNNSMVDSSTEPLFSSLKAGENVILQVQRETMWQCCSWTQMELWQGWLLVLLSFLVVIFYEWVTSAINNGGEAATHFAYEFLLTCVILPFCIWCIV